MAGAQHLLGHSMGRYLIQSVIGSGGFATVYRAVDTALERQVALKVVDPSAHQNPTIGRRFLLEGRAVASLNHPAVVPVYDAGEHDGVLWLAMRLIEGGSLDRAIAGDRRFSPAETLALMGRIGAALDHAHACGVVHRDVKPSNILLEDNDPRRAWLTDFGIAATARTAGLYTTGALGTAAYMAPEQSRPSEVGPPADLYSLACVAYEMLAGRRPFPGEDYVALLLAHATASVPPIGHPGLDELMSRALAKQADRRPTSGAALVEELRAALDADETALLPPAGPPLPARLQAAASVPTVVDRSDETLVYPGAPPVPTPDHRPAPPRPQPRPQPPAQPPQRPYAPPAAPYYGHQPVRDPTVVRTSRRRGRQRLVVGALVLLLGAAAAVAAVLELNRDGGTRRWTDSAGIAYRLPADWEPQAEPGRVTWQLDGTTVATVTHDVTDAEDAVDELGDEGLCQGDGPESADIEGASSGAVCTNSDGTEPATAVAAISGGELWLIQLQSAVPESQRDGILDSLSFTA